MCAFLLMHVILIWEIPGGLLFFVFFCNYCSLNVKSSQCLFSEMGLLLIHTSSVHRVPVLFHISLLIIESKYITYSLCAPRFFVVVQSIAAYY